MEIGRMINGRYLLRSIICQGQVCTVYQGIDQRLKRNVAVKVVPAAQIPVYKAAVQKTAQFSHPNIISLYDLLEESDKLYLVQECVEGTDFATLLQAPLQPYEVADIGAQLCQALLYASGSSRRVCHGDLTPTAILRDNRGYTRINNFALPSDLNYFTRWSHLGGEGMPISDTELPWGLLSAGRQADDARAVGLLLYQLLAGRPVGATSVEPSPDGQLYFMRNVPPELCQIVARTVIRQYPDHIANVETLFAELHTLREALEPAAPIAVSATQYQPQGEVAQPRPLAATSAAFGNLINALPARNAAQQGSNLSSYRAEVSTGITALEQNASSQTIADASLKLAPAQHQQVSYPETETSQEGQRASLRWLLILLVIGLVAFALFFIVGYFLGHALFPG